MAFQHNQRHFAGKLAIAKKARISRRLVFWQTAPEPGNHLVKDPSVVVGHRFEVEILVDFGVERVHLIELDRH